MKTAIKEDGLIEQINFYCQKTFDEWRVPGAAVAIVKKGSVIFEKGYGTKKYGTNVSLNPDTLFPIASITKGIAAASVALLVDQGKVKWNDRIIDYLPAFRLHDPWVTREFQIIDLIIHRSGLPAGALEQMAQWGYSREDIKRGLAYVSPVTSFRSAYAYVNTLYLWIEDLIDNISGLKWGEFVKQNILQPLDMFDTDIIQEKRQSDRFTTGHILDEETKIKILPVKFSTFPEVFHAAGGLVSSVRDLTHWILLQLGYKKLISKENMDYMHTPYTSIEPYLAYGAGWRIMDDKPYRVISHGGLIMGIKHRLLFVPKADAGIVVLTNLTDSEASTAITDYFADCVMGLAPKDYSQELLKTEVIKAKIMPKITSETVNVVPYVGRYLCPILGKINIEADGKSLLMTLGPKQAKAILYPFSKNEFTIYFLDEAGSAIGEGYWGAADFSGNKLILKGTEDFESESFVAKKL